MSAATPPAPSLRERSKARRRDAIERAAMRLFATKGYDETTVTEIAAAAEVSPRTVSLYYPSKADLVMAHVEEAAERLTAAIARRPAGESLLATVGRWLREDQELTDPELRALRVAMFEANPALKALRGVHTEKAIRVGSRALAEELGVDENHAAVRIARAAAVGVMDEYAVMTVSGDPAAAYDIALTFLAAGLAGVSRSIGTPPGSGTP